jgi:hypothetical protein
MRTGLSLRLELRHRWSACCLSFPGSESGCVQSARQRRCLCKGGYRGCTIECKGLHEIGALSELHGLRVRPSSFTLQHSRMRSPRRFGEHAPNKKLRRGATTWGKAGCVTCADAQGPPADTARASCPQPRTATPCNPPLVPSPPARLCRCARARRRVLAGWCSAEEARGHAHSTEGQPLD